MTVPTPPFDPVELPSTYAKAVVGILTATLLVVATAVTDNRVEDFEIVGIALALVTAVGVYLIPNLASGVGHWAKMIVALLGTGLQALLPFVTDGEVTLAAWLMVVVAALGAVGVGIVPNVAYQFKGGNVPTGDVVAR